MDGIISLPGYVVGLPGKRFTSNNSDMGSCRFVVSAVVVGVLAVPVGGGGAASAHDRTGDHVAVALRAARVAEAQSRADEPAADGSLVARYDFDLQHLVAGLLDDSGNGNTLKLVSGNGGGVRSVPHSGGLAMRFPAKCVAKASRCPHAALQAPTSADLNPGTRPLAFGATVLLARSQTTKGQNVVQKGYSTTSSQYKLQIDGYAGHPSCVLVGARPGIKIVHSSVSVTDGSWHDVECWRDGGSLSVVVDGVIRGNRRISPNLSVSNGGPLSIGGKGAFRDNDQFQGIIDDVWVRVG
jgi:concanavalin A-like lectin/glucanase superfamily protein